MTSFLGASGSLVEQAWAWYVLAGTIVLLFFAARIMLRLAARHTEADRNGRTKAVIAILLGIVLSAGGFVVLSQFETKAVEGIHHSMIGALNVTVGEGDYIEAQKTVASKDKAIRGNATVMGLQEKVALLNATYQSSKSADDKSARDKTWGALNGTITDLGAARVKVLSLTANHQGWLVVQPLLARHDDAGARQILDDLLSADRITSRLPVAVACKRSIATGLCALPLEPAAIVHTFRDLHTLQDVPVEEGVPEAYLHQDQARAQMNTELRWFVYPGITGLAIAPFAFVGGSILGNVFETSETVGYKSYPGKAAGFFLLLGAFGIFAIPFAAMTLRDLHKRSIEGQIAL